jgi:Tol biopolymer transport system component
MLNKTPKIIAGAATVLALLAADPAVAAFPGENGRIAFMRKEDPGHSGPWQIWVASADLRQQTKITSGDANSGWPVWAPNGKRIAFDSDRADPDPTDDTAINDILTMNPDGSDVTKLTPSTDLSVDAAWSPDAKRLAFASDRAEGAGRTSIYTMSDNGSRVRRVTKLPPWAAYDLAPRISPDGRRIVFARYRLVERDAGEPPEELGALHIVNLDGSHLRQLTGYELRAGGSDWKPDGKWIVFEKYVDHFDNDPGDIYIVRPDGSKLTNLTHNTGATGEGDSFRYTESSDPVWSPDGRTIMFTNDLVTAEPFFDLAGLATMKPNGTQRAFVPGAQHEHEVDWESLQP